MLDYSNEDYKGMNVNKIDEYVGKVNIIDIRQPYEFEEGTIKTAVNVPMANLLDDPDKYMDMDKEYYLLCRSGARSNVTCMQLKEYGFDVIDLLGGMMAYTGSNKTK